MSVEAITWALAQKTGSPSAKVVLLALANYADVNGRCWPAQKTLAEQTDQSVDSIQRRLVDLEQLGLLRREQRQRATGHRTSNLYILAMPQIAVTQMTVPQSRGSGYRNGAATATAIGRQLEPSLEPLKESPPPIGAGHSVFDGCGTSSSVLQARRSSRQRERLVTGRDGRQHFNPDFTYITKVGNIVVAGAHAELALKSARKMFTSVEPDLIDAALLDATAEFNFLPSKDTKPPALAQNL